MSNGTLLGADGKPDMDLIWSTFPQHGSGEIEHFTSYGQTFRFAIYRSGVGYEAVILAQPAYGSRSNGLHETHRLPGPNGFAKVCFANHPPDLPTAIALSIWWAECTSKYIRNGRSWS
ncbi:hypothetical protein ELH27_37065 [Rhizobium leguminosarum]|uniref:Uncharacterized protein n=1 Tax=Rhizobium beringeri TaxID=3019934 RepID=A0ABY1XHP2_9HYPH|nr:MULTISPECIES: hypothetical protein [Rhizobium]TBC53780.1 hypothetical protein ELH27_37065 [Rhizobium leguminosarum]TBE57589.1 hypothetical protein ELH03_37020 [Rhizobium beringeri]